MGALKRHDGPKDMAWLMSCVLPEPNSGCWLWVGALNGGGYGNTQVRGASTRAHRLAWELAKGAIPPGLELDHKCRVRCCVNPDHLEPVPHRENILRGKTVPARNFAKSECPAGHKYDGRNAAINGRGHRRCRECNRLQQAKMRRAARARLTCEGVSP